ncbi:hypothetical protein GCM10010140_70820 [Streptosporangium pseudovulgare]|uniref:Uncharacterized protein n=1 Tax=Streptosporangium pseudovulgare TaxID=35765 RepID=A0ABQ2RG69_9ACTN|nr:hypothetical protein GCM10010140_70820 [Streptosporangium pseudovulgare]
MLGLPGTWQTGRSDPTSAHCGSAIGSRDHPGAGPPPEASASKEAEKRDGYHDGDDDRRYEHEKKEDPERRVDHGLLLSTG